MVFGIIPECRSESSRIQRSASPESPAFATGALISVAVISMTSNAVSLHAQARTASSYAEDRAAIEDLQGRYLSALDFHDPDLYVSTFTPDGVLDYAESGSDGGASTRRCSTQHFEHRHQG
jgi:hypothetical protein